MLVTRKLADDYKFAQLMETDSYITQLLEADLNMTQCLEENLNGMPLMETDVDTALSQFQPLCGDSIGVPSDSLKVRFIHRSQTSSL